MCRCRILCGFWSGSLFKQRHEMAPLQKRGSLGRLSVTILLSPTTRVPKVVDLDTPPVSRPPLMWLLEGPRFKQRHEMALLQKRGSWGATFRDQASCPSNPQRTGIGVQAYRGARVMVFACVAADLMLLFKQRHEMAPLQKRGSLGRHSPGPGLLPQQPATDRHRCSGISGSPGYGLCLCSGGILCRWTRSRSKRRHEMAPLHKRGSLGRHSPV